MTSGINALVVKSDKFEVSANSNSRSELRSNDDKSFEQVFDETNRNNDTKKLSSNNKDSTDERISSKNNSADRDTATSENTENNSRADGFQNTRDASSELSEENSLEPTSSTLATSQSPLVEAFISDLHLDGELEGQSPLLIATSSTGGLGQLTTGAELLEQSGFGGLSAYSNLLQSESLISKNSLNASNGLNKSALLNVSQGDYELNGLALDSDLNADVLDNNAQNSKFSAKFDSLLNIAGLNNSTEIDTLNPIDNKVSQYINGQISGILNPSDALRSTPTTTSLFVGHGITSPAWGADVAEKVLWLASQGLSEAEIQLDPPELGPLQARIVVHNDQAQVSFNSHSSQVRDALDQTANRLRELFSQEGLNLVDVNISGQSNQEQRQESNNRAENDNLVNSGGIEENTEVTHVTPVNTHTRLVDSYA